jgi:MFS transporter, DHA1 family, multidrug resistance protein
LMIFIPMMICYFGLSLIFANASSLAMSTVVDKAHGSAVMNFINMGFTTLLVLSIGLLPVHAYLMPILYIIIAFVMFIFYRLARQPARI